MKRFHIARRYSLALVLAAAALTLGGCFEEKMVAVSVTGYNHIPDESIIGFTVNDASGPNLPPYGGGGGFMCCASIPLHWKPGMKATVHWAYGSGGPGSRPPPPPQSATVEIPEYTPENMGTLQVHFYPNHRVVVISTQYGLGHPYNPLPKEDWAPWTLNEAWARNQKWQEEQARKNKEGSKE